MNFDLNNLVRDNVKSLLPYSSARDEYKTDGEAMIFLDANENPFENGLNRYPDPQQMLLKSKISEIKQVPEKQILLGNGSDEVLDLIFRAFCEPGKDNIISLPPTYGMYKVLSGINNIENREVLLTSEFEPDVDAILEAVDANTKLLFLCSPNNPSGNSFNAETIKKLLKSFNGLVVIDEAYIDFSDDAGWSQSLDKYPNLIITQTFSKAFGMAGIRLGMLFASAEIIKILNRIKPPYNVNELTQQRAIKGLQNYSEIKQQVIDIKSERDNLSKQLLQLNYVAKIFPSDANFLLIKVDDADQRYMELIGKGIVVRNRSKQPLCENCLRITVGTALENQNLLKAFKELES
ncbi:histidinol-phosphate transaminase [uncultured Christiangramia sp.]|uniref:histidinol-phosphate transaminase n=1 Tax=uncultured Christiangramia sp. TaxID=503836 RepID=UPI0025DAEB39|nr:histidinol-phosphate transaminase [uncultured Christiangramia sp.]|tara:strand:+ start:2373 stop:3419 length:1047 start_codon:yes stop_codon:yes gene_type:complete